MAFSTVLFSTCTTSILCVAIAVGFLHHCFRVMSIQQTDYDGKGGPNIHRNSEPVSTSSIADFQQLWHCDAARIKIG